MKMQLRELNSWFEDIEPIIFDLNISINNARYLIKEIGTVAEQKVKSHSFFIHHTYQLKFIIIIQLCKILQANNNQKRNIFKLFNRLRNEKYDEKLNELLKNNSSIENCFTNKSEIKKTINFLTEEISYYDNLILKITVLRNEVYAHKDKEYPNHDISWEELEILINLSTKCYKELYSKFHNCDFRFERTPSWNVSGIIQTLARHREKERRLL